MPQTIPDDAQRQSIGAANQFIRRVARREKNNVWAEKARLLDDLLDKPVHIFINDKLPGTTDGKASAGEKTSRSIDLNPNVVLKGKDNQPLEPSDPNFLVLVGLLLRLADLAAPHGRIEAYGEENSFYQALNENFDKHFAGLPPDKAQAIKDKKA